MSRPLLAHAFGVRYDLPLPLWLFVVGGALAVLLSFLLIEGRPVRPARTAAAADRSLTDTGERPGRLATAAGAAATLALAFGVWAGLTGTQDVSDNILPTWTWVVVWVVVPLTCGLVGDWTRPVNPFAFLARLADSPRLRRALIGGPDPLPWPRRLGWWPSAVLYALAVCGELVYNRTLTVPQNLALALLDYTLVAAVAALVFGRPWRERGEVFTVLFATWGRLGWWRFGAPGPRGFAGGFAVPFEASVSRVAFVLLLLVSVNVDGLFATPAWNRLEDALPGGIDSAHQARLDSFRTLTFLALALVLTGVFLAFAVLAARAGRHGGGALAALAGLLPSIVPIAFGYLVAHYLQYVLVNGQLLIPQLGNPVGEASWPLRLPYPFTDDYEVDVQPLPSGFYWYAAVVAIVAAHVVAVLIAHRHLLTRGADRSAARLSEYPWLVAMVGYTMVSLWLLAQPLVEKAEPDAAAGPPAVEAAVARPAGAGPA